MTVSIENRLDSIEHALAQLIQMVSNVLEEQKEMRADIHSLQEEQQNMREDIHSLQEEQQNMREDIHSLQKEQQNMRKDIHSLQEEQQNMREDIHSLQKEIKEIRKNSEQRYTNIMEQLTFIRTDHTHTWNKVVRNERKIAIIEGTLGIEY